MSEKPSETPTSPQQPAGEADPLASLYKMSRTAGLGSQDYVAINATAVIALLLGVLSFATVFGVYLLVIPAVAIIVGIVAIIQIRNSAGTQTGKGLALLGMLLAVGFVARIGGRELLHARQVTQDRADIVALLGEFSQNLNAAQYEQAYALFSPRFQDRVPKENFANGWAMLQSLPGYAKIKSVSSNGIIDIPLDEQTDIKVGYGVLLVELVNGYFDNRSTPARFVKINDRWFIDDIPFDFRPPVPSRGPGG